MRAKHAFCIIVAVLCLVRCVPVVAQATKPSTAPSSEMIQNALNTYRINFSFHDRPLAKVVAQLRQLTNVNFVFYPIPDTDIPITIDLNDVTLRNALDMICKAAKHDYDFDVLEGAVVVADRPTLIILRNKKPVLPTNPTPEEAEVLRKLDEKVDCTFEDQPMKEAVEILGSLAKVQITAQLPYAGEEFKNVTLTLARVTLRQALFHLCGLKYNFGVFGNEILISSDVGLAVRKAK